MSLTENIKSFINSQKELTKKLENEVLSLDSSDIVSQNTDLKKENESYRQKLEEINSLNSELSDENKGLKNTLYEQLYNEKMAILNAVNRKADAYFVSNVQGSLTRLNQFEANCKRRIDEMVSTLRENRVSSEDEIYLKLNQLTALLNEKVSKARAEFAAQSGAYSASHKEEFEKLHQEGISEQEMKNALKKNNIESLIGLNLLNKLGILFLIIGFIAASQFTYFRLPDIYKGIFTFACGILLLVVGEILSRKKANIFSLGISSGGVAILYAALALSYFGLKIIDMYPALGLCILITVLSFSLSQRYNSQTIAAFALVGGYLPLFSISTNKTLVFSAMGYFIILNLFALINSFRKKWPVAAFIGYALNLIGTVYIMKIIWFDNAATDSDNLITISYMVFAFLIYTFIPIISCYIKDVKFKVYDVVLLGFNTLFSSVLLYVAFYAAKLSDYTGLLAAIFAVTYLSLGLFIDKKMKKETDVKALFYLTGFTFVMLIIPFQFEKVWFSLGWLIEGTALATYGIVKDKKMFRTYGFIACALSLAAFIIVDVNAKLIGFDNLFAYKYLAITLASVFIMSAYVYKKDLLTINVLALKYCTAINIWFFTLYIVNDKLYDLIASYFKTSHLNIDYLIAALSIALSFVIAYFIPRIKILTDFAMKVISMVIYAFALLWLFMLNTISSPQTNTYEPLTILATVVLVIISLMSILALRDLVKCLVFEKKLKIEWYPLLVSGYLVIILTQNLITQYNLEITNASISIIYVITAFCWIVFGFIKRYAFIRRYGLGLSILAVAKLFIVDLSFLSLGYKIVSYFAFGITLIAISFVYQYFSKRLEIKDEVLENIK